MFEELFHDDFFVNIIFRLVNQHLLKQIMFWLLSFKLFIFENTCPLMKCGVISRHLGLSIFFLFKF